MNINLIKQENVEKKNSSILHTYIHRYYITIYEKTLFPDKIPLQIVCC